MHAPNPRFGALLFSGEGALIEPFASSNAPAVLRLLHSYLALWPRLLALT
jgi:hypothetical protein